MPITKSAIKKQRIDRKRTNVNKPIASLVKTTFKQAKSKPDAKIIGRTYSAIDIAVKKNVIKANTGARMKAQLVKSAKKKLDKSPFAKK
ncbi:MAG: 30S ribosomal protein S20 [bacterium]